MTPRGVGWLFVTAQFALLLTLVVLSAFPRTDWPTPGPLLGLSALCTLGGLVVIVLASLQLGRSIAPTAALKQQAALTTTGLYSVVRHPIYSGLLLVVIGLTLRSASWITALVAGCTIAFFGAKAGWEEQQLAERYPDYAQYAARTGRFVPRPPR